MIRRRREAGVPAEARTDPHVRKDRGLASVSNACLLPPVDVISCSAVIFNHICEILRVIAKGDLVAFRKAARKYRDTFPLNPFELDERDR